MKYRFKDDYVVAVTDRFFPKRIGTNKDIILMAEYADRINHNLKLDATVVSIPDKLSPRIFAMNQLGPPMYFEGSPAEVTFTDQIPIIAQPRDKIYVHYSTMRQNYENPLHVEDGKIYLKILYERILCIVRDGVIIPNATWTLVEPDMESWDDILHKTYYDPKVTGGKKVERPKNEWIQMKRAPEHKYLQGYLRHIGPPLIGEKLDIKQGDKIVYEKESDFKVTIEGQEYFLIKQRNICAKIEE